MNHPLHAINTPNITQWPLVVLVFSTLICLAVSIFFLRMHISIVFQNLYYFPILIACIFYSRKGFIFSIILSLTYFILILLHSRDPEVLLQAFVRVCIFILIAWVTSFLSQMIKQAGEKLREKEALFRGIFDTMPSGSAIFQVANQGETDSDYLIKDMNKAALRYENKQKSEVIGRSLAEVNPVAYDDTIVSKLQEVWRSEEIISYPSKIVSGDNILSYYENSHFKLSSGEIVSIYTDVTEKKVIEEELKESEEKFRLAMETTSDGLWDWNMNTGEVYYSPAFAAIIGETHMDPRFESWESRIHPDDRERALASLKAHIQRKTDRWRVDIRIATSDGTWKWVLNRGSVVSWDDDGKPVRMIGTITDISEQKHIEEIIRTERDRAEQYLNIAEVIIVAISREGTVVLINRKGADMLKAPADKIIGLNWFDTFIPPELRNSVKDTFNAIIEGTGDEYSFHENEIIARDGRRIRVSWVNTLIKTPSGQIIGTLSSGEDLTLKTELEQEKTRLLDQIQQNLAQMAYLNDNIRNPLSLIMALSDLHYEEETSKRIHEQVEIIDDSITNLDQRWAESEKVLDFIRKHYQITPKR
ncbi:MAG: PAS domain S-box protein [Methanospirillum sp.]|uniref:PAS domain S-box protein n=1 Tax=Methanospirillum sp. TaxID=45200 RepID=UPI002368F925|nr:PAS domain S-box protein [Methanospirillum sp.]MDD1729494.1 PAS domain S-box protein [Methanospirillum sp.]